MATNDKDDWEESVEEECKNMEKYYVWNPQKLQDFPPDKK